MTTAPLPTAGSLNHNALQNLTTGHPHTQYQRGSEKGQNNGYAGIDANGFSAPPARTVRSGSDPSTPIAGELWVNGGELRFHDGAAQKAVVPTSRQVLPGAGLTGGGPLTGDVTFNILAFTGLVAKDFDPASQTYAASSTTTLFTVDVGFEGELTPIAVRLPATVNASLQTAVTFEFATGGGSKTISNTATAAVSDQQFQALMLALMGDLTVAATNNGLRVQRIRFQVKNTGASNITADIGVFRLRAIAGPRGGGSAL
jgi:hypothetical protein